MVEFAIITPVLILLAFGITEFGRALYQQNILTHQVQAGARYMARVQNILDDSCVQQANWGAAEATAKNIVVYGDVSGGTPTIPNLETANVSITQEVRSIYVAAVDETISACAIKIHAEATFAGVFGAGITVPAIPFLGADSGVSWGGFNEVTLNASTEERYIGE